MFIKNSFTINGCCERPILIDITMSADHSDQVVIFSHGFKGFKDWGPFNSMAEYFASHGFVFVKFNFSYNGTSIENPLDFVDLDAFGNNNFCKELDDLGLVIDWVESQFKNSSISLFGHSRGGSISILKSAEYNRLRSVVSWASPSDLLSKLPSDEKAAKWKKTNVAYVYNGRTKQQMPMYYQFYKNCLDNTARLDISSVVVNMKIPHLHVHGAADSTVLIDDAYSLKSWNSDVYLHIIKSANHVFDACHPYNLEEFPNDLNQALEKTIDFLKF